MVFLTSFLVALSGLPKDGRRKEYLLLVFCTDLNMHGVCLVQVWDVCFNKSGSQLASVSDDKSIAFYTFAA